MESYASCGTVGDYFSKRIWSCKEVIHNFLATDRKKKHWRCRYCGKKLIQKKEESSMYLTYEEARG